MEPVAHRVVDLNRQGQEEPPVFGVAFPHGKDGQQIVISLLQVQVEALKSGPRQGGHREMVRGDIRLSDQALLRPVPRHVLGIGGAEVLQVRGVFGPEVGEGLGVLVKDGVAGEHVLEDAQFTGLVAGGPKLIVPVDDGCEIVQHGRIELMASFPNLGDIQFDGHAVGAGDVRKIMCEILVPRPLGWIDLLKCHKRLRE